MHQGVGGIDVRIGTMRPLLNRWLRESMAEVGANDRVHHLAWQHYIKPTDDVWAAWVVEMWQRHADGTVFKEEMAAEQGDDAQVSRSQKLKLFRSHPESCLKIQICVGKSDVLGGTRGCPGEGGKIAKNGKKHEKMEK